MKVTLDRLRKTARVQNNKPQEVRNLSDIVSTTVWTFKKFGYESELKAEANVSLAVDKWLKSSKSNGKITPKLPIWKGLFLLNLVCGERIKQIFMMIAIQRCQASSYLNLPKKKLGTVGLMQ